jgi:hypothetical protein
MFTLPRLMLLFALSGWAIGSFQETTVDLPDPFAIEIPALQTGVIRAVDRPDIQIPAGVAVTRFRVWLLDPYAQRVNYSGLTASLNRQSLPAGRASGSGREGRYLEIDLTRHPGLALKTGKNVVEVQAREVIQGDSVGGIVYRTSFVLLVGASGGAGVGSGQPSVVCLSIPAPGDPNLPPIDETVPRLSLEEPFQPVDGSSPGPLRVRIRGQAVDAGGDPLALFVNGVAANSPPGTQRGREQKRRQQAPAPTLLSFDQVVEIPETANAIIVEVRDPHQHRAFCNVSILKPQLTGPAGFAGRKYALLVGVSRYDSQERNLTSLQYADRDAEALSAWLQTPGGGAFRAQDIVLLTNQQATLAAVRQAVDRFLTAANQEDLIYLFLAGHGAADPYDPDNYYFLLHDSKVATLKESAYPMRELGDFLRRKSEGVRLISFLDTCHSAQISPPARSGGSPPGAARSPVGGTARRGVGNRGVGQRPRPPGPGAGSSASPSRPPTSATFSFDHSPLFRQAGWTVITSAGADEKAQESSRWGGGHGVFTWSLLQALRDGKADRDGDCQVTAAELSDYLRREVVAQTDGQQTPRVLGENVDQLVLAALPGCRR